MQKKTNWLAVFAVIMTCLFLVAGGIATFKPAKEVIPEGYFSTEEKNAAVVLALEPKDIEMADLTQQIVDLQIEEEQTLLGYLVDKLFLGMPIIEATEEIFYDRDISTLFDGKVRFDGDKYDAEETWTLKNTIELLANERDFEGNVYMTVPKGAIEYKFEFETSFVELFGDLGEDEDETLEFSFLGENYEVSNWDVDEITLTKGLEYKLDVGESVTVDGKTLTLDAVSDDRAFVLVGDEGKAISEGSLKVINGLEVKVDSVFNSEMSKFAFLIVGEDIKVIIRDRDEYEEDGAWDWIIGPNSIGLILAKDFTKVDLDGDEEFQAIGAGEKLCLPNDYVCIQFNGMVEETSEEYYFELYGEEFVRVKGNFDEDYNKIYISNVDGSIYEDDDDVDSLIEGNPELGDTDSVLKIEYIDGEYWIVINDFEVNLDLSTSRTNDIDLDLEDEDWLTNYGILVINPEDSAVDNEFNVFVPEKEIEGSLSII